MSDSDNPNKKVNLINQLHDLISKSLDDSIAVYEHKFNNDISNLENTKYEFYDLIKEYTSISSLIQEYEEELSADYFNNHNANSTFIIDNNPIKRLSTNTIVSSNTNFVSKNSRAKTPFKAPTQTKPQTASNLNKSLMSSNKTPTRDLNKSINTGVPSNINKRLEARKSKSKHKTEALTNTSINKGIRKSDKSPHPIIQRNKSPFVTNENKNKNKTISINFNEEKKEVTSSPFTLEKATKLDPKIARIDAGIQRNKAPVSKRIEKGKTLNDTKALNKTSGYINTKEKDASTSDFLNKSLNEPVEKKIVARSKTPEQNRRKLFKIKKEREFKHNGLEVYALLCRGNYLPLKQRFNMLIYCKETYEDNLTWNSIVGQRLSSWELSLKNQEEMYNIHIKNPSYEQFLFGKFVPSKTGKNGLNFIRTEDENNLITKEQPEEILNFIKIIYILLKEPYSNIPTADLIVNLKQNIFPKYSIDTFSKY